MAYAGTGQLNAMKEGLPSPVPGYRLSLQPTKGGLDSSTGRSCTDRRCLRSGPATRERSLPRSRGAL